MVTFGQLCLLAAFVGSGYAAAACLVGTKRLSQRTVRAGLASAAASSLAVTAALLVLAWALVTKDFRFAYVAQYCSRLLPWGYSLSALWVGQAGSLLLWAWLVAVVALLFRFVLRSVAGSVADVAFGLLQAYFCFLLAILVFAADPMRPSTVVPQEGLGLSPILQHPTMMTHPPIVFAGYALWAVPCALALAALITRQLDDRWIDAARRWSLAAWTVLGGGILLGAHWAYQELGWGGYWGWDPVENGSLIPWVVGTALLHAQMLWRRGGRLKKSTLALQLATFALCNFATFLTRSGVLSSVHAFSQSPIGWMFLGAMGVIIVGGGALIYWRRDQLAAVKPRPAVTSREGILVLAILWWLPLAVALIGGTLTAPLTAAISGRRIVLGPEFYNRVLVLVALPTMAAAAAAPLLRWGGPPLAAERRWLAASFIVAALVTAAAWAIGVRSPLMLAVVCLAASTVATFIAQLLRDGESMRWLSPRGLLTGTRWPRPLAGYLVHVGFACLAVGIAASSLGTSRQAMTLAQGETVQWAGRRIRYVQLQRRSVPGKMIVEALLQVQEADGTRYQLLPAQHFHLMQRQWTTEVAIRSGWRGDVYVILHNGDGTGRARFTFVHNPLIRLLWIGGGLMGGAALLALWPERKQRTKTTAEDDKSSERCRRQLPKAA